MNSPEIIYKSPESRFTLNQLTEYVILLGLCSSFLFPPLTLGSIGLYGSTLFSVVLLPFLILNYKYQKIKIPLVSLWIIILCLLIVCCNIHSALFLNINLVGSDFMELIKYLQFLPYILCLPYIDHKRFRRKSNRTLSIGVYLFIFIGISQFFLISPVANLSASLYSSDIHIEALYFAKRIFITGSDPNIGGAIAFFLATYTFYSIQKDNQWKGYLTLILLLFILINTQGRTTMAAALFAVVTHIFVFNKSSLVKKFFGLIFILSICIYILYYGDFQYVTKGIEQVQTGENSSLNIRKMNLSVGLDRFYRSPFMGWGTAKSEHSTILDSEYLLILQRYGLLGLSIFAMMYLSFFMRQLRQPRADLYRNVMNLFLLFGIVFMTTNNIFSGYQLMSIVVLLLMLNSKMERVVCIK